MDDLALQVAQLHCILTYKPQDTYCCSQVEGLIRTSFLCVEYRKIGLVCKEQMRRNISKKKGDRQIILDKPYLVKYAGK